MRDPHPAVCSTPCRSLWHSRAHTFLPLSLLWSRADYQTNKLLLPSLASSLAYQNYQVITPATAGIFPFPSPLLRIS